MKPEHAQAMSDVTVWATWRLNGRWDDEDGRVYESRTCACCKPGRTFSLELDVTGNVIPEAT